MNETMDEKLKFTGPDSFPHILMWPQYKILFFFFSPVHLTFACKFKSELASFSPEETISNESTVQPQKKTLAEEFPSSEKSQTSTLLDSFFTNCVESPFSYLVPLA